MKQELNADNITYARQEGSVSSLVAQDKRPIPHAGGTFSSKTPPPILAGIVALESVWNPPLGTAFEAAVGRLGSEESVQVGCALRNGGPNRIRCGRSTKN